MCFNYKGTVTAPVVYINFGRRSDYEELIDNENFTTIVDNTSFAGKIGLVRYGNMGRSTKVKVAQDYGMIGLLMFSDPEQYAPSSSPEGYYPDGPWLPPSYVLFSFLFRVCMLHVSCISCVFCCFVGVHIYLCRGVQRGSIKYASCPGNPDLERMQRLCGINTIEEALPTIPVMPLSYGNAEILFENMDGEEAPPSWQGEIDTTYTIEGDLVLELSVITDRREQDLTQNVYGILEGSEMPEQAVMIGAHRDAWVCYILYTQINSPLNQYNMKI